MDRVDDELRAELLAMVEQDQGRRWQAMRLQGDQAAAAWQATAEVDHRNTARMRQIVARYGWPGRSLVGVDGAHAAWLLVQHADHDPQFQRECLELLNEAAAAGEAAASDRAYLVDRVAIGQGRPQVYGTQLRSDGDGLVPAPLADPDHVDQRHAEAGMSTLADYVQQANQRLPQTDP